MIRGLDAKMRRNLSKYGAFPLPGGGTDSSKTLFSPVTSIERERCHVSDRDGRVRANGFWVVHKPVSK